VCVTNRKTDGYFAGLGDGTREQWFGDSGVMKRGPFVVADRGVGPLITERGHLVVYVVENGQSCYAASCCLSLT